MNNHLSLIKQSLASRWRSFRPRLGASGWALMLAFLYPVAAISEEQDEPNWFQIEVILFANESIQWQESELWRDKFELIYPDNLVILKPFREYEFEEFDTDFSALRRKMPGELEEFDTDYSALRREYISPEERERQLQLELELEQQRQTTFTQFDQVFSNPLGDTEQDRTGRPEVTPEPEKLEKPMDLERDPFILLPDSHLQMQRSANRIDRAPDLRLLAHFAWRQPLEERGRAVPVLVQAGDQFDLDFELEGTLTASESRFLHVDSALYFSRFERSLVAGNTDWRNFYKPPGDDQPQTGLGSAFDASNLDVFDQQAAQNFVRTLSANATDSRRLRSKEIHYIDHPLFGILVTFIPHELPDPVMEMKDFDIDALPDKKQLPLPPAPETADSSLGDS